ncbi:HAD family hydrolase [Enterococcus sp. BWM-S5]|uniref:HAD family hydrolase n=1 Tax=Enterococcus larvae TaxID=2794352 RepID=A0ABS4CG63_9ENTE|nr:HAD family hydrolase [Enterococcus larvae]MBP1045131.1 HAD family hydrolase [Enterococcus larvae]
MKAVIFDMDGVLVDSEYTFLESKTALLKDAGYEKDVSYQYQFMGTTFEFMWSKMKEELGLPLSVGDYIEEMNQRREEMIERDGIKAIPHAVQVVQRLSEAGFKLAVASSSPKVEIERAMNALDIAKFFDILVSGEEVAHSKPAPDVFLRAAALLEINPKDCLVFEDTRNGSRAAKAAEMYCIGFENPEYPAQDLSAADEVIHDFQEVSIERVKQLT